MDQETADLICSLQAKKLALLFYGRRDEFLKFMNDAFDSNNISEDKVIEVFKETALKIERIEKRLDKEKIQLISFAP